MPDLSDVERALDAAIAAICYPDGVPVVTGAPGTAPVSKPFMSRSRGQAAVPVPVVPAPTDPGLPISPTIGAPVRVRRGWPDANLLDADLKAGIVNISIYPEKDMSADRTRYDTAWRVAVKPVTTLSVAVAGNKVTFTGDPGVKQLAGVRLGGPSAPAYSVRLEPSEGPVDAAVKLAGIVPGSTAIGPTLTVPGIRPVARVEGFGILKREVSRQEHVLRIILWCPSPQLRDSAARVVDAALKGRDWISLPDYSGGHIRPRGTAVDDGTSEAGLWRRDLLFSVEYPSVELVPAPAVMWGQVVITDLEVPAVNG